MSRQTVAKSRADKAKGAAAAPTPAATQDIVAGKYNEHDWNMMMDRDDGDYLIGDIVEEICESAMSVIYARYIESQLLPYTITQAKDAILQIVEWQFLAGDDGEPAAHTQDCWMEDEEPVPGVTDCWAQGSVPRQLTSPRVTEPIEEEENLEVELNAEPAEQEQIEERTEDVIVADVPSVEEETSRGDEESYPPAEEAKPEQNMENNIQPTKPKKFKPYRGAMRSAKVHAMTESLDDIERQLTMMDEAAQMPTPSPILQDPSLLHIPSSLHSILKLQSGRPPGSKEVMYDGRGNVIGVMKLDPEKLPSHRVKVKYTVIDPTVEAAQARLEAMRTGRNLMSSKQPKPPQSKPSKPIISPRSPRGVTNISSSVSLQGATPLPPPLIDSMEVSAGVVVREGDRVKRGPRQQPKSNNLSSKQLLLRPVAHQAHLPQLTVAEILEHQSPIVKPMPDIAPIPPIIPQLSQRQISTS